MNDYTIGFLYYRLYIYIYDCDESYSMISMIIVCSYQMLSPLWNDDDEFPIEYDSL